MTEKIDVVQIGLGNIGFRHLQGLIPIASRIRLTAIDPSEQGRERSEKEWTEKTGEPIALRANVSDLPKTCHTLLVATPASGRLALLESALAKTRPQVIVLEKVVFQDLGDFDKAQAMADAIGAKVYVNCPRRMWKLYKALKHKGVGSDASTHITFACKNLGLACNSVHLIDALQYLSGSSALTLETDDLGEIFGSKRDGYWESYGKLTYRAATGAKLTINVQKDGPEAMTASLDHGSVSHKLDEGGGVLTPAAGGDVVLSVGRAPYQSELTGALIDQLLANGICDLATLSESKAAHMALFDPLGAHLAKNGIDVSKGLPIT